MKVSGSALEPDDEGPNLNPSTGPRDRDSDISNSPTSMWKLTLILRREPTSTIDMVNMDNEKSKINVRVN